MKLHIKFIVIILGCLMVTGSYAQKVVMEGGRGIIDSSALRNSTKVKKARDTDGTDTTLGTNDATNIGSKVSNETVYYKFEVSKIDNMGAAPWHQMIGQCRDLSTNGTGWRMPTQRELLLMYIMRRELQAQPGFTAFFDNTIYWSATEETDQTAGTVSFRRGGPSVSFKGNGAGRLRCVRDL